MSLLDEHTAGQDLTILQAPAQGNVKQSETEGLKTPCVGEVEAQDLLA